MNEASVEYIVMSEYTEKGVVYPSCFDSVCITCVVKILQCYGLYKCHHQRLAWYPTSSTCFSSAGTRPRLTSSCSVPSSIYCLCISPQSRGELQSMLYLYLLRLRTSALTLGTFKLSAGMRRLDMNLTGRCRSMDSRTLYSMMIMSSCPSAMP